MTAILRFCPRLKLGPLHTVGTPRYGTLIAWARELGRDDWAAVLEPTLEEEKAADLKLTEVAEARLNRLAARR